MAEMTTVELCKELRLMRQSGWQHHVADRLEELQAEVERLKAENMAHRTWENEAIQQRDAEREAHAKTKVERDDWRDKWHPVACDKCGTAVPQAFIAIETQEGAPIDDPEGFMWCVVCHGNRVDAVLRERAERAEAEAARLRDDVRALTNIGVAVRANVDRLQKSVANWERKEIHRASCCDGNEMEVKRLRGVVEELKAWVEAEIARAGVLRETAREQDCAVEWQYWYVWCQPLDTVLTKLAELEKGGGA